MYSNSNITKPIHCELDNSVLIYSKSLNSFLFQSPRFKLSITKFEYSFKSNVLFSVKRRIMEHFGIYEVDLQNSLETLNLETADLLINYYKDISMTKTQDGVSFGSCYLCKDFLPKDLIIEELIR